MPRRARYLGSIHRLTSWLMCAVMISIPSANVFAQTNAAAQAVRRTVDGLGTPAENFRGEQPSGYENPGLDRNMLGGAASGMLDTTYISQSAVVVVAVRPARIMAVPLAQLLPLEVATAAGQQYLGFDPATVEELVVFSNPFNPVGATQYGVTLKFTSPFRATSIPPHLRPMVQLADLGGKRYLQSGAPAMPSFYGPNNRTMVAAPDVTLRQLVTSQAEPKTGPLVDLARNAPAGSDLYVAIDVASLRPLAEMGAATAQSSGKAPPGMAQALEYVKLVRAVELTMNVSAPAPSSVVLHANDEAAADQLVARLTEEMNKYQGNSTGEQAAAYDPVSVAMQQYTDRITQPFRPQREGTRVTVFQIDGQNPAQQQLMATALVGMGTALALPAIQAARNAAQAQAAPAGEFEQPPPTGQEGTGQEFQEPPRN